MAANTRTTTEGAEAAESTILRINLPENAEFAARLAALKRRKDDPEHAGYVQRLREGAEEARRQINEEVRRQMDEETDRYFLLQIT